MRRKIIKIADTTYVVSLPLKWARENNVKKGDEVELEIEGKKITLKLGETEVSEKKIKIDVGNNLEIGFRTIVTLYRLGYDEFEILFSKPEYLTEFQKIMSNSTIGLAIIKQKEDSIIIKDLSGKREGEIDNLIRRIWFLIMDMSKDICTYVGKNDYDELKNMYNRERIVNQIMNYCIRQIASQKNNPRSFSLYYFVRELESISDSYRDLALRHAEKKSNASKDLLLLLKEVNNIVVSFYESYYTFDLTQLESILFDCLKWENRIKLMQSNDTSVLELIDITHIIEKIKKLISPMLELHF
jgi:phosphate uptake regulator